MSRSNLHRWWIPAVIVIAAPGCQSEAPSTAPPTPIAPAVKQAESDNGAAKVEPRIDEQPAEARSEPDAPPVAAVKTLLAEIDAGHPEAFAEFLPESYRTELAAAVHDLAAKVPDEQWSRWQSLAAKATSVIQRKLDLMTEPDDVLPDDERRARLAAALERLADPEAWKRENWQTADLKDMLKGPASDVLTVLQAISPQDSVLSAKTDVKAIRIDKHDAVLSLQSPLDPEPRKVDFVKVDEQWIPKSLADGWKSALTPWRDQIEKLTEAEFADAAAKFDPYLQMIEGTLDEMLKAEHADELQLGWWQIQSVLLQARQELLQPGPAPKVELHLASMHSEEELSLLLEKLVQASDQPELAEYVTFPTTSGITIHLSPVNDPEAFVGRLTFLKVISRDDRQMEVELKR